MIYYGDSPFQLSVIFMRSGSVLPQAFTWAFFNCVLAMVLHWFLRSGIVFWHPIMKMEGTQAIWGGYTAVLGFLVVFRNNQAYARFWEGATLVNQTRGEWFNAVSSLMAFCNTDPEMKREVDHFQNLMIRLASLLHCSALQEVCEIEDANLEILDCSNIDQDSLYFLEKVHDRCEIIMSWIQRLIMKAHMAHVVVAPPPILSRSFQELSRGVVNLNNVRKIRDIPFPFPYNQVLVAMLAVHWLITPMLAASVVDSTAWAGIMCFFVTGCLWAVIYIAKEIDQPFGEDPNDLPMVAMQRDFNRSLLNLMHPRAKAIPNFEHRREFKLSVTGRYSGMSFPESKSDDESNGSESLQGGAPKPVPPKQGRRSVRLDAGAPDIPLDLIPEEEETKADMGKLNEKGLRRQGSSSSDGSSTRRQKMLEAGLPGEEWVRQISQASDASCTSFIQPIPKTDENGRRNLNRVSGYGQIMRIAPDEDEAARQSISRNSSKKTTDKIEFQPVEIACHECGTAMNSDWRYCTVCGHGRPVCGCCGNLLAPEVKFCHQCGRHANSDSIDWEEEPPPTAPHRSHPGLREQFEHPDLGMSI